MSNARKALEDALFFIEQLPADLGRGSLNGMKAQTAYKLRAALAEPEPQPVALMASGGLAIGIKDLATRPTYIRDAWEQAIRGGGVTKLYTHPKESA